MKFGVIFCSFFFYLFCAQAENFGSLPLKAKVIALYDLQLNVSNLSTALSITNGSQGVRVGTSDEVCNVSEGYNILVSSRNDGELRHESDEGYKASYTLRYAKGLYVKLSKIPQVMYSVTSLSKLTKRTQSINVNVDPYPKALAGVYSDVVTFTIEAR